MNRLPLDVGALHCQDWEGSLRPPSWGRGARAMSALRDARVALAPNEEWRFEVDHGSQAVVTLTEGHAEIFGTELVAERRYTFSGVKLAVFTWHGCALEVEGSFSHQYTAHETPMLGVLQFHEELEQRRNAALATLSPGPRVMVVGSDDCGKSTMCRILANYAARRGHGVTYVDLDVGQPLFGPLGTISATAWQQPLDLEQRGEYAAPVRTQDPPPPPSLSPSTLRTPARRQSMRIGDRKALTIAALLLPAAAPPTHTSSEKLVPRPDCARDAPYPRRVRRSSRTGLAARRSSITRRSSDARFSLCAAYSTSSSERTSVREWQARS